MNDKLELIIEKIDEEMGEWSAVSYSFLPESVLPLYHVRDYVNDLMYESAQEKK